MADLLDGGAVTPIEDGVERAEQLVVSARRALAGLRAGEGGAPTAGIAHSSLQVIALCAAALLAAQGLVAATDDPQRIASAVMDHQFLGDLGPGPFDALRGGPGATDPPAGTTTATHPTADLQAATWAVEFTAQLLGSGRLHRFTPA